MKVEYLQPEMVGQDDQTWAHRQSLQILISHILKKAVPVPRLTTRSLVDQVSLKPQRVPAIPQVVTLQNPGSGPKDGQFGPSGRDLAMGIWNLMSVRDQVELFSEQLRIVKDFWNSGLVMRGIWDDGRKRERHSVHIPPTPSSIRNIAPKRNS